MKKLAVLLYKDTNNPNGIPGDWPAQAEEISDETPFPGAPWIEMTVVEYNLYRKDHRAEYNAWQKEFLYNEDYLELRDEAYPNTRTMTLALIDFSKQYYGDNPDKQPPQSLASVYEDMYKVDQEYPVPTS